MEHLYDGICSVKHDMKNHMAVLQNLIRKKYSGEDEEIRQYFEDMYQSVEQLDNRVHTGNAVSDAVVGSKFRFDGVALFHKDSGLPISTKEEVHGIGLKNIRKGNRFILSVMVKSLYTNTTGKRCRQWRHYKAFRCIFESESENGQE